MAIRVTCPACGAKRSLSDAFRGLNVTCPKCGNRFTAADSSSSGSGSGSSDAVAVGAESATSIGGLAENYRTASVVSYPAIAAEPASVPPPPPPQAMQQESPTKLLVPTPAPPAQASTPEPPPAPAVKPCEYKVLVPLAQATGFRPDQLEQVLNDWAREGWRLKSTAIVKLESPDGPRDDLIVILER